LFLSFFLAACEEETLTLDRNDGAIDAGLMVIEVLALRSLLVDDTCATIGPEYELGWPGTIPYVAVQPAAVARGDRVGIVWNAYPALTHFTELSQEAVPLMTTCIDNSASGTLYTSLMLHGGDYAIAFGKVVSSDWEIHNAMFAP
jgi:hypothetical protein